jgi:hypothetical protein
VRVANDVLRFVLEICALGALAYWGWHTASGVLQVLLGLGAPILMAVVWGRYMSPKAPHPVEDPVRIVLEVAIFGAAVAALFAADKPALGAAMAVAVALHLALTFPLRQRRVAPPARADRRP